MRTTIGRTRNATDDAADPARAAHERQVRQARLENARSQTAWKEIPETRLVRRGWFLVDAESDVIYVHRRGVVFEPGRATVGYVADSTPLAYYVDQDEDVVFLEQPGGTPRTWSELVARKARRA